MSSHVPPVYPDRTMKWYSQITSSHQPQLPPDATATQREDHAVIKVRRLHARGVLDNGQPLITKYFFPLDPKAKMKFREFNGGMTVLPELFTPSQVSRATNNPTKNGPEHLKSKSGTVFEVAYQPTGLYVRHHMRGRGQNSSRNQNSTPAKNSGISRRIKNTRKTAIHDSVPCTAVGGVSGSQDLDIVTEAVDVVTLCTDSEADEPKTMQLFPDNDA